MSTLRAIALTASILVSLTLCAGAAHALDVHKMHATAKSDGVMLGTYPRAGSVTPNTVLEGVGMLPMQRVSWDRWSWIETSPGVYDWNQAEFDILSSSHKFGAEAVGSVYMANEIPSFYPQDINNAATRQAAANFIKAYYQQMEQVLGKVYVVIDYEMQWYDFDVEGIAPNDWTDWYVMLVNEVKSVVPDAIVICDVIADNHNYFLPGGGPTLEEFDQYVSNTQLRANWVVADAKDQVSLKWPGYQGSIYSMRLDYHNNAAPYWTAVTRTFSSVQDWSEYDSLGCWYRGFYPDDPPEGNSGERFFLRLYDQWGGWFDGPKISNATKTYDWVYYSMDISSWANRGHVQKISVLLEPEDYGTGQIYVDKIHFPEDWLKEAMSVSDALGIDDYGLTPQVIHNDIQWMVDRYADGKPIYVLENGFSTWEGSSNKAHGTEAEQASYLEDVIDDIMTSFPGTVKSYLQFMYPDAGVGDDIEYHWGLVTFNNGREKPALDVFRQAYADHPPYTIAQVEDVTDDLETETPVSLEWQSGTEFDFLQITELVSKSSTTSATLNLDFTNDDGTGEYILEANGNWKYMSSSSVDVTDYLVNGTNTINVYFPQISWPGGATVTGATLDLELGAPAQSRLGLLALVLALAFAGTALIPRHRRLRPSRRSAS
jgi:hypothetical protein